ncbi:beta-ketoacyl synthase chain length factor [Siccirubricoccus sp. G192]|uniref:beta-ketoacyl synthase chain length factor n=1 Tax=Siccirubricoccus sp. G192 TaxID=2849651 RepID=UPI001C2C60BD|nr:beta-ketoacyl synthase chain length factor [Siccirubricoccus sp. G192]MBV1795605.1 beta-ketoacyl synthase chain length factor [Siccirubricoccus sp. G192]
MTVLEANIIGVSVWGPGLEGWAASRPVLAGEAPYEPRPSPAPPPAVLPPTERRRTGPVARLALVVAQEAAAASGLPPASLRSVFASSNGDGVVVGGILDALATIPAESRPVSPTQFHNSVHNAAAGYWSIANASAEPATCLGLHDDTWAAGLLKAMAEVVADAEPVLLCAYDHPLPAPLDARRPTLAPFGLGLVLAPPGIGRPLARLAVRYEAMAGAAPPVPRIEGLRPLAAGNAAARALPLLEALARGGAASHFLPYGDGSLTVTLAP